MAETHGPEYYTRKCWKAWAPPPMLTVTEWADRYRMLSAEASAEPGRWQTSRAPYQAGVMDALSDPELETVVFIKSAQVGATEILNNVVGYFISQDPATILVMQPNVEMAETWSKDRFAPMLRDTPSLRGKVKDPKSRDSGNTISHKSFPGGHLTAVGANAPAGLASRPIRIVLCDEVDRYPASAGTEGDPIGLARKRTATFWNRKILLTSTPTVKGCSRIELAWGESDQRRFHLPCPACKEWLVLKWSNVKWDAGSPENAAYACEHCGTLIGHKEKPKMLKRGVWIAQRPENTRTAGFHINELYSPWRSWGDVALDFLEAKRGGPSTLQVWTNTSLGETWEDTAGEQLPIQTLLNRRERYEDVPMQVGLLTAGIDVQGDRLETVVYGWGRGEESWLIHWEVLWGDPGRPEVWARLDAMLSKTWTHASGTELRIAAACVDTGGHHSESVYRFCGPRLSRRVHPIKGASTAGHPLIKRAKGRASTVKGLLLIGVDTAKDLLFARLKIPTTGSGYVHFPMAADEEFFSQLTAERAITRYERGIPKRVYEKTRPRNEALDCTVYALAALASLGRVDLGKIVDELQPDVEDVAPENYKKEPAPEPAAPRQTFVRPSKPRITGSGWTNGWKR